MTSVQSRWISAHAGSGKTYQLVRHMVSLLLAGEPADSIICLTYTNAAAAEMQERLLRSLGECARLAPEERATMLSEWLGVEPDNRLINRAGSLAMELLESGTSIRFHTIHGFCQRMIQQFPLESGVFADTALADDRLLQALRGSAFDAMLKEASHHSSMHKALQYVSEYVKESILQTRLEQASQLLSRHADGASAVPAIEAWYGFYGVDTHYGSTGVAGLIDSAYPPSWNSKAEQLANACSNGNAALAAIAKALHDFRLHRSADMFTSYAQAWLTQKQEPRSLKATKALLARYPDLLDDLFLEQQRVLRICEQIKSATAAEVNYHFMQLVMGYRKHYQRLKKLQRVLDFDDVLHAAHSLLSRAQDRPWVMQKLDMQLRHLLLDEAQDTSPLQWSIIRSLCEELWQPGGDKARSLFVVGDHKQSIYSFQGAKPECFAEEKQRLSGYLSQMGGSIKAESLIASRRSAPLILAMVDAVLAHENVRAACSDGVSELSTHSTVHKGMKAHIACWPLAGAEKRQKPDPFVCADAMGTTPYIQASEGLAQIIAEHISQWLDSKRWLACKSRHIRADDILILLQTRSHAPAIIAALESRGVPVSGLDRLALSSHLAVQDHLAFMEWALHPHDDYHLAIALRSPLGNITEEELFTLAHGRGGVETLWQSCCRQWPDHPLIANFTEWAGWARDLPTADFLAQLHVQPQLRERFCLRFGNEVIEVLDALLSEAENYALCTAYASPRGFVSWFGASSQELKREQEQGHGRVRVMTVHASKGLESPVVILADATYVPSMQREQVFAADGALEGMTVMSVGGTSLVPVFAKLYAKRKQAKWQEYYRLLYVALTRAVGELYLTGIDKAYVSDVWPHGYNLVHKWLNAQQEVVVDGVNGTYIADRDYVPEEMAQDSMISSDKETNEALPAWMERIVAVPHYGGRVYTPSQLGRHVQEIGEKRQEYARKSSMSSAEKGVLIHRVLEQAGYIMPDNYSSCEAAVRAHAPNITQAECSAIAQHIWSLLEIPKMRWLWQQRGYSEAPIAGTLMIEGQARRFAGIIDRLIVTADMRYIIDYKTGAAPADIADIPEAYLLQMRCYKALLEADATCIAVTCGLLYTATPTLYWLDESSMPNLTLASLDGAHYLDVNENYY